MTSTLSVLESIQKNKDLPIRLGEVGNIKSKTLYGVAEGISANIRSMSDGLGNNETLSFANVSSTFAIASDNNSDDQTISIEYYASPTSEDTETQIVVLNGQTKVTIINNMFRIMSLTNLSANNPSGTIRISLNSDTWSSGVPNNIYALMTGYSNKSHMGFMYVPINHKAYIQTICFNSSIDSTGDIYKVVTETFSTAQPNSIYRSFSYFAHGNTCLERVYTNPISGGFTSEYKISRIDGGGSHDATVLISYFLVKQ